MKKIAILMIAIAFAGSISGCQNNKDTNVVESQDNVETQTEQENAVEALSLTGINKLGNSFEVEVKDIQATKKAEPSMPFDYYTYYSAEDNEIIIQTFLEVKNIAEEVIDVDGKLNFYLEVQGKTYEAQCILEDDGNFGFVTTLDPFMTGKVHFLTRIPAGQEEGDITLRFKVDEITYETTLLLKELEKRKLQIGEVLTKEDKAEITFSKVEYADRLEPSNPADYYSFYEVSDSNNTYVILAVDVKNLKETGLQADKVLSVKGIVKDKYQYDSFSTLEEDGNLNYTNITEIQPLETRTIYYLCEVPKELQGEPCEMQVIFEGEKYYITVE